MPSVYAFLDPAPVPGPLSVVVWDDDVEISSVPGSADADVLKLATLAVSFDRPDADIVWLTDPKDDPRLPQGARERYFSDPEVQPAQAALRHVCVQCARAPVCAILAAARTTNTELVIASCQSLLLLA